MELPEKLKVTVLMLKPNPKHQRARPRAEQGSKETVTNTSKLANAWAKTMVHVHINTLILKWDKREKAKAKTVANAQSLKVLTVVAQNNVVAMVKIDLPLPVVNLALGHQAPERVAMSTVYVDVFSMASTYRTKHASNLLADLRQMNLTVLHVKHG